MQKNKYLTKEIIRHLLACFGAAPHPNFGKAGLSALKISKELIIEHVDEESRPEQISHPIFFGEGKVDNSTFQAALIDLSVPFVKGDVEYCVVFRVDNLPIHGLRLFYTYDDEFGDFKIYDEKSSVWIDAPLHTQGLVLNGIERAVSAGITWSEVAELPELYNALIKLIEI